MGEVDSDEACPDPFEYCDVGVLKIPSFKGHDMLGPCTAGWQTTDLHPLVIERSDQVLCSPLVSRL